MISTLFFRSLFFGAVINLRCYCMKCSIHTSLLWDQSVVGSGLTVVKLSDMKTNLLMNPRTIDVRHLYYPSFSMQCHFTCISRQEVKTFLCVCGFQYILIDCGRFQFKRNCKAFGTKISRFLLQTDARVGFLPLSYQLSKWLPFCLDF